MGEDKASASELEAIDHIAKLLGFRELKSQEHDFFLHSLRQNKGRVYDARDHIARVYRIKIERW
jgi:hypothetical protein